VHHEKLYNKKNWQSYSALFDFKYDFRTNNILNLIYSLQSTNIIISHSAYCEIIDRDKQAIPYLINNIQNTNTHYGHLYIHNIRERSSNFYPYELPVGMISAYFGCCGTDMAHQRCSDPSKLSRCRAINRGLDRGRQLAAKRRACRKGME